MSSEEKKETGKKQKENKEKAEWNERAKDIWLAGLGALAAVEEEGGKLFRNLVEKGSKYEDKRKEQLNELWKELSDRYEKAGSKAGKKFEKTEERIEESLKSIIAGMGIPTKKEMEELSNKIDALNEKVDKLRESGGKPSKKK